MKWVVVNSLTLISSKDPSMNVWIQCFSLTLFFFVPITTIFSHFIIVSCGLLQTLLNQIIFCVKDYGESSFHLKFFLFCLLFEEFLQKKVNVLEMKTYFTMKNKSSMINSKNERPFWVVKEVHLVILQALIEVCFQLGPFVANLSTFNKFVLSTFHNSF